MTVCDNIKQRGKKVVTLDSQFFRKLVTCGYKGVSRWYRKVTMTRTDRNQVEFIEHTTTQVKLLEQDLLVVINDRTVHWTLLVYARTYTYVHVHYTLTCIIMPGYMDLVNKQAEYYDSYLHDNPYWEKTRAFTDARCDAEGVDRLD